MKDDFVLSGYPHLEKIVVKKNSLQNLNSLKISNNELLKNIEIEDGSSFDDSGSFSNVKTVIIEGTFP